MGIGALVIKDGERVFEVSTYVEADYSNSNNVAEYVGFLAVMNWLIAAGLENDRVVIYGDSNLVIRQMLGEWRIKEGRYVKFAREAKEKVKKFSRLKLFLDSAGTKFISR